MTTFEIIVLAVGGGLLLLGGASGYALFTRSTKIPDRVGDEANIGTLWALFMLGVSAGLFLIWIALP